MVSGCVCVHPSVQEPCMLGFWNFIYGFLMEKYLIHVLFLSKLCPFLELCPFEKIWMTSDAYHILWTMHSRVLKLHMWIPHGKIADTYFFLVWLISLSGVMPFEKIRMKSCQQDISKSIWARGLKLGQLIGDDKKITWLNLKKITLFFWSNGPLKIWAFRKTQNEIFSARYLKVFELGAWNLVSW